MIIDRTITNAAEVESALNLANIQWQLSVCANNPNLTFGHTDPTTGSYMRYRFDRCGEVKEK